MNERHDCAGFTLIEAAIASALLVPLIVVVAMTGRVAVSSTVTNQRSSDAAMLVHSITQRCDQLFRAGLASSCETKAIQADVDAAIAAGKIPPAVGDWIVLPQLDPRPNIRMRATEGVGAIDGAVLTPPRSVEFVIESTEIENDLDDDGDELIDEGALRFGQGGVEVDIAHNVEQCTFQLDGDSLEITLAFARRENTTRRVFRTESTHTIWLRNR